MKGQDDITGRNDTDGLLEDESEVLGNVYNGEVPSEKVEEDSVLINESKSTLKTNVYRSL